MSSIDFDLPLLDDGLREDRSRPIPANDGRTHINVYSQGATQLGRALSNFAATPFVFEGQSFASVEGFWYWWMTGDDGCRLLAGNAAKAHGRSRPRRRLPPNATVLRYVYTAKLAAHPAIAAALKESALPLYHYYVFNGQAHVPERWLWTAVLYEELRAELQALDGIAAADTTPTGAAIDRPAIDLPPLDLDTGAMSPTVVSKKGEPSPTVVFDTYWRFAAERQAIYFRRLRNQPILVNTNPDPPPATVHLEERWTHDPILQAHRFTNCYRAADRVSQYLIRDVIYTTNGLDNDDVTEVIFRVLLFKIFNRIQTWERLVERLGCQPMIASLPAIRTILDEEKAAGTILYSNAYMIPSPGNAPCKHRAHLQLLDALFSDERGLDLIRGATTLQGLFEVLRAVPSFGAFLAMQYAIDLNYSACFNFDEDEFIVPGPGARDGLKKCFSSFGEYDEADLIRWICDRQEREFDRLGLPFETLFGRRLHRIDCQSGLCECDKYARVAHPEIAGRSGRSRIKQLYKPDPRPLPRPFFPPKWDLLADEDWP